MCDQKLMVSGSHGRPREEIAPEDREDIMGTFWAMALAIREQAVVANWMMEWLERQGEEGREGDPDGVEVDLEYLKFTKFKKASPPCFWGTFNPDKAEK